jgi:hypothetical protein
MTLTLMWLFLFGAVVDVLWCLSVQTSASYKTIQATMYTVLLTSIQLWANWQIIKTDNLPAFICYVVGCAVGTALATNRSVRRLWKK